MSGSAATTKTSLAGLANTLMFWNGDSDAEPKSDAKQEDAPQMSEQKVIGTVRFSYDGMALIYTPTKAAVEPGTLVTVLSKDGSPQDVQMRISDERKDAFLVADIISGTPTSGQLVVTKPVPLAGPGDSAVDEYQILP